MPAIVALADQDHDRQLAGAQAIQGGSLGVDPIEYEAVSHLGAYVIATSVDLPHGSDQLLAPTVPSEESGDAELEQTTRQRSVPGRGKGQDLGRRMAAEQPARELDRAHSGWLRAHDHDPRRMLAGEVDGALLIPGLGDDAEMAFIVQ